MGLNAVAADKVDKITHVHCHGNLQQLLFAVNVSLLFGVSAGVWFWLRLAWELPKSGRFGFGYELCHGCGASSSWPCRPPLGAGHASCTLLRALAVQIASQKNCQHRGGGF